MTFLVRCRWFGLALITACHCGAGIVQPLPVAPPTPGTPCWKACEVCEPDDVQDCAVACARDQAQGVASQLNPGLVLEAGVCPNP